MQTQSAVSLILQISYLIEINDIKCVATWRSHVMVSAVLTHFCLNQLAGLKKYYKHTSALKNIHVRQT